MLSSWRRARARGGGGCFDTSPDYEDPEPPRADAADAREGEARELAMLEEIARGFDAEDERWALDVDIDGV